MAFQQADYVAWNVWAAINGRPLLPFKYQHLGDMMSLGSINGAVTLPLPVPSQLADSLRVGFVPNLLTSAYEKLCPPPSSHLYPRPSRATPAFPSAACPIAAC